MAQPAPPDGSRLSSLLRDHTSEILAAWKRAVHAWPKGPASERPTVLEGLPAFLDKIARDAQHGLPRSELPVVEIAHAEVLGRGDDPAEVVVQLAMLRDCITRELCDEPAAPTGYLEDLRVLNLAIDTAAAASVDRYTAVRDWTLREFDRLVTAAIEEPDLEALLRSLLRVLCDASPEIDTAAILLREADMFRVRAAIGIDMDVAYQVAMGEGFAGAIAADRRPHEVDFSDAGGHDVNPSLRAAGIRGLYGIPLANGGGVIGVVYMGSRVVTTPSTAAKQLLDSVASRATAVIYQHLLRETAERTAHQLAERELELHMLADNIPQLAWMADRAGAMTWCNQRWLDFTGLTLADALGSGWQKIHHPAHLARVIERVSRAIARGEVWEDTFPMRGKDGRYRWFLTRGVPIRDAHGEVTRWFGTNTDVTAQRCLSEATKLLGSSLDYNETLEKLAQLAVPDLADWCVVDVVEADGPRRIAVAQEDPAMAERVLEWGRRNPPDWAAPIGSPHVIRTGEPEFFPEISEAQLVAFARDADQLAELRAAGLVSMIAVPLTARDRTLGALTLLMARSARHYDAADVEVATELGRRAGQAIENTRLYREAQEEIRLREQILAIVSHDLRNPLSAIDLGACAVVDELDRESPLHGPLQIIRRSTARMQRLIEDLLNLARLQSGTLKLEREVCDATELLSDSIELNEPLARAKGITVVCRTERSEASELHDVTVLCDRHRIEQVFANLFGNAIKFCRAGDQISVCAARDGDRVRYVIEDTGPGIPSVVLPNLFAPYAVTADHSKDGVGLGLYICKGIVEAHGGTISAASPPGAGATFTVTLPVAEVRSPRAGPGSWRAGLEY